MILAYKTKKLVQTVSVIYIAFRQHFDSDADISDLVSAMKKNLKKALSIVNIVLKKRLQIMQPLRILT